MISPCAEGNPPTSIAFPSILSLPYGQSTRPLLYPGRTDEQAGTFIAGGNWAIDL